MKLIMGDSPGAGSCAGASPHPIGEGSPVSFSATNTQKYIQNQMSQLEINCNTAQHTVKHDILATGKYSELVALWQIACRIK